MNKLVHGATHVHYS